MANESAARVLVDFVKDGDESTSRLGRFFAALCGSLVLHLSMCIAIVYQLEPSIIQEAYLGLFVLIITLSGIFALIISAGSNGSLVRRFLYGVSLPAFAYSFAVYIISPSA